MPLSAISQKPTIAGVFSGWLGVPIHRHVFGGRRAERER